MKNTKIISISFQQEADCCSNSGYQILHADLHDGGGGYYPVLRTEEWAFDGDDIDLFQFLVKLCKRNDRIEGGQKK